MAVAYAYQTGPTLVDMAFMAGRMGQGSQGYSYSDALTAHAGGTRAAALVLTSVINNVSVVGSATDSVALPAATGGQMIAITNSHASNAAQVFAAVGTTDTINGVAAATGIALANGKTILLVSTPGAWWGVLSA